MIWNDQKLVSDVKSEVLRCLEQLCVNHPPEFIYFKTLYHVFERFISGQDSNFTAPKQVLEIFRTVCQGKAGPYAKLCELFDEETSDGKDMSGFSALLEAAISAIASQSDKKNLGNLFAGRGGKLVDDTKLPKSASDFDLVTWLVIMREKEAADV